MDSSPAWSAALHGPPGVEEDDYESLPGRYPVIIHMGAGAAAGLVEHCSMYPVDCVKTRMQSLSYGATYGSNTFAALGRIVREEGVFRPVRGISAMAAGAVPAHAAYFSCYEKLKEILTARIGHGPVAHSLAGSAAALVHDAVMNPAEVVKQRMQMYKSPYRSCWHCVTSIIQNEGVRAFYRSYFTQLAMNVPFQSIHFMIYELSQDYVNPTRSYNAAKHSLCGAIAGAVAAAVTTPLDVCKTVLNTQEGCIYNNNKQVPPVRGLVNAFKTVYKCCGFRGYFQGMQARVIYQIPSTALSWLVYESIKYALKQHYPATHEHSTATPISNGTTTKMSLNTAALLGHAPLFYTTTSPVNPMTNGNCDDKEQQPTSIRPS